MIILYFDIAADMKRVTERNSGRKEGKPFATLCGQFAVTGDGNVPFTEAIDANDFAAAQKFLQDFPQAAIVGRVEKLELVTPTH